jgi:RNA polymerase sigma-70 factor (ECF subfamily)
VDEQVQEVMHQVMRSLPSFDGRSKVTTWLYGIARNIAYQSARERKRHILMEPGDVAGETPSASAYAPKPGIDDPDVVTTRRERKQLVREALGTLPPHFAEVIRLRDLDEQSTTEAAAAIGITEGNTRVRLHRARKALREALAPFFTPTGAA